METARYHRLDQQQQPLLLPDPDDFELELDPSSYSSSDEKIYHPPPTRRERLGAWARRHLKVVALVAVFLVVAVLYAGLAAAASARPTRLMTTLIGHPDNGGGASSLKKALADISGAGGGPSQQLTVTGEDQTTVKSDGKGTVTIDVAGSDVLVDGKENGTSTSAKTRPDPGLTINVPGGGNAASSSPKNTTAAAAAAPGNSAPPKSTGPAAGQASNSNNNNNNNPPTDSGQVSINDAPGAAGGGAAPATPNAPAEPVLPITAVFYSGSEGPKACRGHVIAAINMPKPAAGAGPTAPQCYNFPNQAASGCANFVANKGDGCIAQVFAETSCRTFMNTAAFMAEDRPVGGNWKSVRVQCGIPEPDPASLGKPPMMDAITSMKDNDKAKGGRRRRANRYLEIHV